MNIEEYHKMHALEKEYWWFQGRRQVILKVLEHALRSQGVLEEAARQNRRPFLLDVGCGTGMLLEDLGQYGTSFGLDFSPVALEYCRQRHLENLGRADVQKLPVRTASVDVITALDLIEHVKDDEAVLREIYRVLRPGGIAVMSVPAHKSLWSNHDVALHHCRRYEKGEFLRLVTSPGLEPLKYTYTVAAAYFPAALYRRTKRSFCRPSHVATDEFPLPRPVNAMLLGIMKLEARLLVTHNLPFGLSLLCVARKPE